MFDISRKFIPYTFKMLRERCLKYHDETPNPSVAKSLSSTRDPLLESLRGSLREDLTRCLHRNKLPGKEAGGGDRGLRRILEKWLCP